MLAVDWGRRRVPMVGNFARGVHMQVSMTMSVRVLVQGPRGELSVGEEHGTLHQLLQDAVVVRHDQHGLGQRGQVADEPFLGGLVQAGGGLVEQ